MKKLIKLLNEYMEYKGRFSLYKLTRFKWVEIDYDLFTFEMKNWEYLYNLHILSKRFWFIKWLVENDKLDEEELQLTLCDELKRFYKDYEILIMQLSISDKSIYDLIKLLK